MKSQLVFSIFLFWLVGSSSALILAEEPSIQERSKPFSIAVTLSERALQKLVKQKETIIVSASFSGKPPKGYKNFSPGEAKFQELFLGSAQKELSEPGIAEFHSYSLNPRKLEDLSSADYQVLVNVFSGRRSTENNFLTCDAIYEKISIISGKTSQVECKLTQESLEELLRK